MTAVCSPLFVQKQTSPSPKSAVNVYLAALVNVIQQKISMCVYVVYKGSCFEKPPLQEITYHLNDGLY